MKGRLLLLCVLAAACATDPSIPTAPEGTVARAQQNYNQALLKCQDAHPSDANTDAGLSTTPTEEDTTFSKCLAQTKADLDQQMRQAEHEDGGPGPAVH